MYALLLFLCAVAMIKEQVNVCRTRQHSMALHMELDVGHDPAMSLIG